MSRKLLTNIRYTKLSETVPAGELNLNRKAGNSNMHQKAQCKASKEILKLLSPSVFNFDELNSTKEQLHNNTNNKLGLTHLIFRPKAKIWLLKNTRPHVLRAGITQ